MQNKGILIVISGPAGSGKGTVVRGLLAKYPETYVMSVSATTREPRPGEVHGVEYYFLTIEEFGKEANDGNMLEFAKFVGAHYGTPRAPVERQLAEGKNVILEIDVQGALQVKRARPDAVMIFLTPPDYKTLEARLRGRGTESEEKIVKRLTMARSEIAHFDRYDYHVVNKNGGEGIAEAVQKVHQIISCEERKTSRNMNFIQEFYS